MYFTALNALLHEIQSGQSCRVFEWKYLHSTCHEYRHNISIHFQKYLQVCGPIDQLHFFLVQLVLVDTSRQYFLTLRKLQDYTIHSTGCPVNLGPSAGEAFVLSAAHA